MEKAIQHATSQEMADVLRVQTCAMRAVSEFMYDRSVTQLMPVLLSPFTDPLAHEVHSASIDCYGQELMLTKSMTVHKPLFLMHPELDAIYSVSPCIRLETEKCPEKLKRYLFEFSQLEMEFKEKDKEFFMSFMEDLVVRVFTSVKKECGEELRKLGRELRVPRAPFKKYSSKELEKEHGEDYEKIVSQKSDEPFWILGFEREFYDKEEHNYDLVWPEGFGEALSGGERDYEHAVLLEKMQGRGMDLAPYESYLTLAEKGLIPQTVGGGLGVERMVRFLTGLQDVGDVTPFPRKPWKKVLV